MWQEVMPTFYHIRFGVMTKQIHVNVLNGHVKWGWQAFDSQLLRFVAVEKKTSEKILPSTLDPRKKNRPNIMKGKQHCLIEDLKQPDAMKSAEFQRTFPCRITLPIAWEFFGDKKSVTYLKKSFVTLWEA